MPVELFMIWIITVLLIVLVSLSANKKAQQNAQKNARAAKGRLAQPPAAAKAAQASKATQAVQAARAVKAQSGPPAKSAFMQAMAELQAAFEEPAKASFVPKENPAKPAAEPRQASPQGTSMLDEEGCVGGSMAHAHTEGESRAEHGRHQAEVHRREAEETRAAQAALELKAMNLRRLRQAVVMAEILDRPKALRMRHP